jgi:hypothetical protein
MIGPSCEEPLDAQSDPERPWLLLGAGSRASPKLPKVGIERLGAMIDRCVPNQSMAP